MVFRTAILWIHALAGAAWVGACGCFVAAGLALPAGGDEQRNFFLRAAPKIDAFSLAAAAVVLLSGGVNLAMAGTARNFAFSPQFGLILGAKVILFVAMSMTMAWTMRKAVVPRAGGRIEAVAGRIIRAHGAAAAMGAAALLLGLWLMGS